MRNLPNWWRIGKVCWFKRVIFLEFIIFIFLTIIVIICFRLSLLAFFILRFVSFEQSFLLLLGDSEVQPGKSVGDGKHDGEKEGTPGCGEPISVHWVHSVQTDEVDHGSDDNDEFIARPLGLARIKILFFERLWQCIRRVIYPSNDTRCHV